MLCRKSQSPHQLTENSVLSIVSIRLFKAS
jgi:hypothetical protein